MIWKVLLILVVRGLDLWTTYAITPDLRQELNPIMRRIGWKWIIALNATICPIFALNHTAFIAIVSLSLFAILWNLRILSKS